MYAWTVSGTITLDNAAEASVQARKDSVECLLRPAMLPRPIKNQRLVSKARARLCSPANLFDASRSKCYKTVLSLETPIVLFAFIVPGDAGASDLDKSIWVCTPPKAFEL